jgi:serine/threonine protein kinase
VRAGGAGGERIFGDMQQTPVNSQRFSQPSAPGTDQVLPRQFGKYTLLRSLARGGMAEVYLALQRAVAGFEKLVVIKRILPELARDQSFVEMLLHEARVAATLSHPNIVQTFDVGEVEGTYYIAMEHVNGEDIRSIVRAMKRVGMSDFPLEHALSIVRGVCAGLAYAHDKRDLDGRPIGIVHRDVSPQNVLVTFEGDVKVVDFGIAKSTQVAVSEGVSGGQLKGKIPYMSPEQATGQPIDHRSDIFSVGIVLFELSTGRRLFKSQNEHETLKLICEREYPRPSQVRPGYPAALELIVMKALQRDVNRRYQSARELQADLETFIRSERVAASTVELGRWMELLFEDKIVQQKAALQDAKQLADVIATQYSDPGESMIGIATTGMNLRVVPGAAVDGTGTDITAYTTVRGSSLKRWLAVAGAVIVLVGVAGALAVVAGAFKPKPVATAAQAAGSGPAEAPAAKRGKISIKTDPAGCDVWLSGELQKSVTPTTIDSLPLGREMTVKITKEGFESFSEAVTLSVDDLEKSLDVKMVKGSVTVVLKVTPLPAVYIDGKKWAGTGDRIEQLSAGEHKIVVSAVGFLPQTFTFVAKMGETKTIEATLVKGEAKTDASGAPVATGDEPPKPKGTGKVRIGSKGGFCEASVNGRGVGSTPTEVSVPEGPVSVSCRTADGRVLSSGATVKAGETAKVSFSVSK